MPKVQQLEVNWRRLLKDFFNLFIYTCVWLDELCASHVCRYPWRPERGCGTPRTGATHGYEWHKQVLRTEPWSSTKAISASGSFFKPQRRHFREEFKLGIGGCVWFQTEEQSVIFKRKMSWIEIWRENWDHWNNNDQCYQIVARVGEEGSK